jgi:GNAT superfamily N-acetyltransferase
MAGAADHIAVVATVDSRPGRLIGLASAALTSDGSRELGLLVEDQYQAQGIGTMMMDALRDSLDPDEPLCAYALAENRWLLGKLARFGALTIDHEFGVFYARVEL